MPKASQRLKGIVHNHKWLLLFSEPKHFYEKGGNHPGGKRREGYLKVVLTKHNKRVLSRKWVAVVKVSIQARGVGREEEEEVKEKKMTSGVSASLLVQASQKKKKKSYSDGRNKIDSTQPTRIPTPIPFLSPLPQ